MKTPFQRHRHYSWLVSLLVLLGGLGAVLAVSGSSALSAPVIRASQGVCTVLNDMGVKCQLGSLPAGSSATVVLSLEANAPGFLLDTARVKGDQKDPEPGNNEATVKTKVIGVADLEVTKSASPDPVVVGKHLTFTIIVTNNGPSAATGVEVTDKLPPGVTFVSCSENCVTTISGSTLTWRIGTLLPGASRTIKCVVIPTTIGPQTNKACAEAQEHDPNRNNNCATITANARPAIADLSVIKKADKDTVLVGDNVTYTITITNNGPDDATGVELSDVFSTK
ncbi:MAG: DUF11 domain-containing protein [Chloroflexi bacterium]|nr:DUF11 domain-containing protein [Chloroflexota bacterium]